MTRMNQGAPRSCQTRAAAGGIKDKSNGERARRRRRSAGEHEVIFPSEAENREGFHQQKITSEIRAKHQFLHDSH